MKKRNLFMMLTCLFLMASSLQAQLMLDVEGDAAVSGKFGIGLGDDTPATPLSIMGNGGTSQVGITQKYVSGAGSATMEFTTADGAGVQTTRLLLRGDLDGGDIEFYRGARNSEVRSVHIEGDNGNVGIGTSTPAEKLEVVGNTKFLGRMDLRKSSEDGSIFIGRSVGEFDDGGNYNVFIGDQAGSSNSFGALNTFIGADAGKTSIRNGNTFIGHNSGRNVETGGTNTHIGQGTGFPNNTQWSNTIAIGASAEVNCNGCATIGSSSVPVNLGLNQSTPSANFHIQQTGGVGTTTGIRLSGGSISTNNWRTTIDADNDYIFFYNGSIRAFIRDASGSYEITSDRRLKKNISTFDPVLEKVMRLKPSQYYYKDANNPSRKTWGFVAQEVEAIFPEIVGTKNDYKALVYDDFAILSIKAIQEVAILVKEQEKENKSLQESVSEQQIQINDQQQQIDELKLLVEKLLTQNEENPQGSNYELQLKKTPSLNQNQPNPFRENTLVNYFIPDNAQNAHIRVTNVEGKLLGTVKIQEKGQGQVTIKAAAYPAGTYYYSLVVDGEVFETKRMVLTR